MRILASTSGPFRPTTVQMLNLTTITETKRITVQSKLYVNKEYKHIGLPELVTVMYYSRMHIAQHSYLLCNFVILFQHFSGKPCLSLSLSLIPPLSALYFYGFIILSSFFSLYPSSRSYVSVFLAIPPLPPLPPFGTLKTQVYS